MLFQQDKTILVEQKGWTVTSDLNAHNHLKNSYYEHTEKNLNCQRHNRIAVSI